MEEQGTWASRTRKYIEAGCGRPEDGGMWTAKTLKRSPQQPPQPQYAYYWAPLTCKRHIPPHPAQPRHTNHWAPRTRKRHQQEHRPQQPTESSDPTQHAKGRTGDCPGPRKETTTRRNVTQGGGGPGGSPPSSSSSDGVWPFQYCSWVDSSSDDGRQVIAGGLPVPGRRRRWAGTRWQGVCRSPTSTTWKGGEKIWVLEDSPDAAWHRRSRCHSHPPEAVWKEGRVSRRHDDGAVPMGTGRHFFAKDSPQGPPTAANLQPPPTANRHQLPPTANSQPLK